MYAIIKHGGKQYKVEEGNYLNLDHFNAEPKAKLELSEVLALNDGELKVGAPFVKGAKSFARAKIKKSLSSKNADVKIQK